MVAEAYLLPLPTADPGTWALMSPAHQSVPLRVSCPGPLLRLACLGGGRSGPGSPLLGLGLWGWRKGVPGGGAFHCCEGRLGSGAPPPPTARPLGGPLGSATHMLWARACGCGGPTLSPWPACPVGAACREGAGGPSPYLAWGCAPPVGRVRGVRVPGGGLWGGGGGGGAARAPCPLFVRLGGACRAGGRSASFRPSAFPGQATKRVSLALFWSWGAWPPIPLRFVLARLHLARSVRHPGALAQARLFPAVPVGARGWGGGAGRAPAPLLGGARGDHPPCLGGRGPGPPRLAGRWGGWRGGRVAPRPPSSPSGWRPAVPYPGPPLVIGALPPGVRVRSGSRGRPWGGGGRGAARGPLPRGPFRPEPPSALPEWAIVMGGSWGARPPYCSGAPPCAARRLGPRAALARWCGLARRPRPPREQAAGGAGAGGVQVQPHPPPPRRRPFWGRGGVPLAPGGRSVAPVALKLGGGGTGGGVGGPPHRPPPPRPVGLRPAIRCLWRASPGYTRAVGVAGRPRASGAARSAANGSVRRGGRGGGGNLPALVRAPVFPRPASEGAAPFALSWAPPVRRQSAAGRAGACGRFTGGACRGRGALSARVQRPLRGGCGAAVSSVCVRPLLGLRGRGGEWGGPSGPLAPPPDGRQGAAWRSRPWGPAVGCGVALFPRPPLPRA